MPSKVIFIVRVVSIAAWVGVIAACFMGYLADPGSFTPENIAAFLRHYQAEIWLFYLGMSVIRGFTLLPSTPLVLAGTILFPDNPIAVLAVSILGIVISSSLIYYCSGFLGFRDYFEKRRSDLARKIRTRLEHPAGIFFVALWAFTPVVPTDAVCYVAGTIRMTFSKFILALVAGELILCSIYVFLGGSLWRLLG